jgi:hypothetical protein
MQLRASSKHIIFLFHNSLQLLSLCDTSVAKSQPARWACFKRRLGTDHDRRFRPWARAGAPTGKSNGRYRHGRRTREAIAERRAVSKLVREVRASIARLV